MNPALHSPMATLINELLASAPERFAGYISQHREHAGRTVHMVATLLVHAKTLADSHEHIFNSSLQALAAHAGGDAPQASFCYARSLVERDHLNTDPVLKGLVTDAAWQRRLLAIDRLLSGGSQHVPL